MIYQLQATEYETVRPLFKDVDWHLSTCALLDGAVSGTIYVDHPVKPSAAVAWIGHRFYVVGSHHNDGFNADLRRLFAETVYPWAQEAEQRVFVLYYFSDRWERVIEEILRDKHPMKDQRQYYVFRELQNDWRELIRPGFALRPVDGDLLEGKGPTLSGKSRPLRNLDRLAQEVLSEEPSVEAYLRNRFGFCLTKGEEIVGWCLSEYNGRDRCEMGIETLEGHRRQGVATITAGALVEHALSRGITRIGWHCWASNAGSVATALRVGFRKEREYPVFFAWFDETANLAVNGNMCFRRREYADATAWYDRAFETGEAPVWAYWNAARANAMTGQAEAALVSLRRAVEKGFTDVGTIMGSEHLKSLHVTRGWRELVEPLRKA